LVPKATDVAFVCQAGRHTASHFVDLGLASELLTKRAWLKSDCRV
jgi:hypothetical protein